MQQRLQQQQRISIHAPAKGATRIWQRRRAADREFQSTLPRRERPPLPPLPPVLPDISIHAPAKGATTAPFARAGMSSISIHAPAKGATGLRPPDPRRGLHFNPRSREGSDLRQSTSYRCLRYFNPRSREGSDPGCLVIPVFGLSISIHAPAKGATITRNDFPPTYTLFQSTLPRRERPGAGEAHRVYKAISIHAPAKGATFSGRA